MFDLFAQLLQNLQNLILDLFSRTKSTLYSTQASSSLAYRRRTCSNTSVSTKNRHNNNNIVTTRSAP